MSKYLLAGSLCLSLIIPSALLTSCRKKAKDPEPVVAAKTYGAITVKVSNEVDGSPVTFGAYSFTNAKGERYSINILKYYISNFTLVGEDNTETNYHNYKLIDAKDTSTCRFTLDSIPNGNYKAIKFYIGVDSLNNHTGLQEGDLDPIKQMIWGWKIGYIFFKHEGTFRNDTGGSEILLYHLGTDEALSQASITIPLITVKGNDHTLYLKFNLNDVYHKPNDVGFKRNNIHQSTDIFGDAGWLLDLRTNMPNAFTCSKVE
ncbi:MAG: hypothetical protein H7257_10325 [Taibaiella sp.]|nr:hypothetical protein [Taibaiella sp.]